MAGRSIMPDNPNYVTCSCRHCDGHIEFDAADFSKGEERPVECPHCHLETILFVPSLSKTLKTKLQISKKQWIERIRRMFSKHVPTTTQSQQQPAPPPIKLCTCPDCGQDVSIRAEACPHCGAPFVQKKSTSRFGCPKCGSDNIYQKTHSSGARIGLFLGGIVLAFFTCGLGLVLCVIAVFLNEKRGHCRDCKWTWKT
jgi:predicted RNA-binding Zn-ribbon protein involved in translation (DUF1610 family)